MRYLFEDYALDTDRRELRRGGTLVAIEPQVFDLLAYLVQHGDRVVTKDDLFTAVWNGRFVSESALTTRINAARTALGDDGKAQRLIRTLRGRGFRFVGDVRVSRDATSSTTSEAAPTLALPDKPSIAVMPFQNMSGDPEQEYFADGMVEEIITALSRIRWLFVIARNSTFIYKGQAVNVIDVGKQLGVRYVLEGSVRKAGSRVRITGQLIDASTGAHVWADIFDGSLEDVFDLQAKVAGSVAGVIEPTLVAAEMHRVSQRPTSDATAYDLYLQALAHLFDWEKNSNLAALDLLRSAVDRDPNYGPALVLMGRCYFASDLNGWSQGNRDRALEAARRALLVAGDNPQVLSSAGFIFGYFGEDIEASMELADRALMLNPSYAKGWYESGTLRLWAGQPDSAISYLEKYLRLSPKAGTAGAYMCLGMAHFFARRFEDATRMLLLAKQERPNWPPTYRFLAACYAQMGQLADARATVERLRAITPLLIPSATHWRNADQREFFLVDSDLLSGTS